MTTLEGLPVLEFKTAEELRTWLEDNLNSSNGIWVRIYKKKSMVQSVTFEQVLDEGLCFGWSENKRRGYDKKSYLQRFTPRKTEGTQSSRNLARVKSLIEQGKMMPSGLSALGFDESTIKQ